MEVKEWDELKTGDIAILVEKYGDEFETKEISFGVIRHIKESQLIYCTQFIYRETDEKQTFASPRYMDRSSFHKAVVLGDWLLLQKDIGEL